MKQLKSTGLPVTYLEWPEGEAPDLPFICYLAKGNNPLFADGVIYYSYDDVCVELYTKYRDLAVERQVEAALDGYHWKKDVDHLKSERCYKITYDLEV